MAISGFFNTVYPNFALVKVTFKIGTPEHGFISVDGIDGPHDFCGNKAFIECSSVGLGIKNRDSEKNLSIRSSKRDVRRHIMVNFSDIW